MDYNSMKYKAVFWDIDGTLYGMQPIRDDEVPIWNRMHKTDWMPDEMPDFLRPHYRLVELMASIPKARQGIITNGREDLQKGKLDLMDLAKYVNPDLVFTSYGEAQKVVDDSDHPLMTRFDEVPDDVFDLTVMQTQKPKTYMYERALEACGFAPEECVMIGDDWKDIDGANGVGMDTIYIARNKQRLIDDGKVVPNHTVENGDFDSLTELLI